MFFIRYNWSLSTNAQFVLGLVLVAALGLMLTDGREFLSRQDAAHSRASQFAAVHHNRCLERDAPAAAEFCAIRTIQLASQLHGLDFGDQVAEVLR